MSTAAISISAESGSVAGARPAWAIAAVLGGMVLVVLDAAIANVALPTIGHALRVSPALAVKVVTAYQLGLVVMLLPAAALGERFGYRRIFMAGAMLFTAASALCALAPSLPWLIAARFLQGLGGAEIMALGIALLRFVVPHDRLGAAIGWNALTVALATATGPALGALILSVASWPWLFAVNLPIGAAVVLAACALPMVKGAGHRMDFTAIGLNSAIFALLVAGAEWAASRPAWSVMLFAGAGISAAMLIRREAGRPTPLVPLDLLRRPAFRLSVVASVLCFVGQAAAMVALPFYLQHAFGLSALTTGLLLTPWPLLVAIAGPVAGKLANQVSTAWLCLAGGLLLAVGLGSAALWPWHAQPQVFCISTMICGLGFGLFNVPNNRNMFLSAPRERSAAAGGLQGVARLTGQIAGAVTMGVLFELLPLDLAPRVGLALAAMLTLAAGVLSLLHRA